MSTNLTAHERDVAIRGRVSIGRYIRELRDDLDLTQRELSKLVGLTIGAVSKLEGGTLMLPSTRAERFAETLMVNPAEFALTVFRHAEPYLFTMIFPNASLEPLSVSEDDIARVTRTLDRLAIRQRRSRARRD